MEVPAVRHPAEQHPHVCDQVDMHQCTGCVQDGGTTNEPWQRVRVCVCVRVCVHVCAGGGGERVFVMRIMRIMK